MIECFKIEESPYNPGKYMIQPIHENFYLKHAEGSYGIICARLMNLSYAQWLRFCRDCCGAQIVGKNHKYPVVYFEKGDRVQALCRLLNSRANLILFNREHPDWEEHAEYVKKKKETESIFGGNNVFNS